MARASDEDRKRIEEYQSELGKYPKPSVTADIVALRPSFNHTDRSNWRKNPEFSIEILFIRRGQWPFENYWALPGGFLRPDESVEGCAKRELKEETDLDANTLIPIGVFSKPGRDMRAWIISNAFLSIHEHNTVTNVKGGDDAATAKWLRLVAPEVFDGGFSLSFYDGEEKCFTLTGEYTSESIGVKKVSKIDDNILAFDHGEILVQAILHLLSLDTKELAFYFLPEKFTLAEYIDVYLYLLRKRKDEFDIPNFRRLLTAKNCPLVVVSKNANDEEEYEDLEGRGHAKAKLYKRVVR